MSEENSQIDKVEAASLESVKKHAMRYLKDANIVGMAIGKKIRNSIDTNNPCISFLVEKKLSKDELTDVQLLPSEIEELGIRVKTDVIESGSFWALQVNTVKERPARPGASIGHQNITAGTFGAIAKDNTNQQNVILSNNHVLSNVNDASVGDEILQPGPYDGGIYPNDVLGTLIRFEPINFEEGQNLIDAAICQPNDVNFIQNLPHDFIPVPSSANPAIGLLFAGSSTRTIINPINHVIEKLNISFPENSISDSRIGMNVQKSGRTTGGTSGTILNTNATVKVNYDADRVAIFHDQIITGNMSAGGDSGSLVIQGGSSYTHITGLISEVGKIVRALIETFSGLMGTLSSKIQVNNSMEELLGIQAINEIMVKYEGADRLYNTFINVRRKLSQTRISFRPKDVNSFNTIRESLLKVLSEYYLSPENPKLTLSNKIVKKSQNLFDKVQADLPKKERIFLLQILHLFEELQSKKLLEIIQLLGDEKFYERIPAGGRYIGNSNTTEIHDLDNYKNQCQIEEIIESNHIIFFRGVTLDNPEFKDYDRCHYCLGKSKR